MNGITETQLSWAGRGGISRSFRAVDLHEIASSTIISHEMALRNVHSRHCRQSRASTCSQPRATSLAWSRHTCASVNVERTRRLRLGPSAVRTANQIGSISSHWLRCWKDDDVRIRCVVWRWRWKATAAARPANEWTDSLFNSCAAHLGFHSGTKSLRRRLNNPVLSCKLT